MDNKELDEKAKRLQSVYEAISKAVPEHTSVKKVQSAAVFLIANSIIQANLDKDEEDVLCDSFPTKIKTAIELLREEEP